MGLGRIFCPVGRLLGFIDGMRVGTYDGVTVGFKYVGDDVGIDDGATDGE